MNRLSAGFLLLTAIALAACAPLPPTQDAPPGADSGAGVATEQDLGPAQGPDTEATTGLLEIVLTDAPPDLNVEKALITISSVEVHLAGADDDVGEDDEDDDGDGIREVHVNTAEGMWTTVRNFLRPLRGVHKKYLSGYVAVCEFGINLKRITPAFISALVALH